MKGRVMGGVAQAMRWNAPRLDRVGIDTGKHILQLTSQ
jgi:hypothetical protein